MDDALRAFVWERAGGRCEYCQLHQGEYEYQTPSRAVRAFKSPAERRLRR
jgi:hypothetical protein